MFWCRSVAKFPGLERVLGGGRPNIRLEPGMFTSIIDEFNSGVLALISLVCGGMLDPIGLYNQQMEVLTLNFERAQRKCLHDATGKKKNAPKTQRRSCNNG